MRTLKLLFTILIAFGFTYNAAAQNGELFKIDVAYIIKDETACNSLKIIDQRPDKEDIGYVSRGYKGRFSLVTGQSIEDYLPAVYDEMRVGEKDGDQLLLVLYDLQIKDRVGDDESGIFYVSGDFFRGNGDNYHYVASLDSLYEVRSETDVTDRLLSGSQVQIQLLLAEYGSMQAVDSKVYTLAAASAKRKTDKQAYPIYTTANFKKGIYYTVDQFLNNAPVDTPFVKKTYIRDNGLKTNYLHYLNEKGKTGKQIDEATFFAAFDGTDWWVPNINYCTIMRYQNGEFYATKFFNQRYAGTYSSAASDVGLSLGLLGALVATSIDMSDARRVKKEWSLYSGKFDPITKEFKPVDRFTHK
ncbi:MAG: hypothetical protein BGO70_05975 [Bacteroidetes bacterium 43-93]|mgnify:CR=1 FL=1|nr:hypothetical protein [Bacteroidota bacterium]OJW97342.1 MAG: hypothetical protein BGO70_05975 [Bacteroidetes bacterium 43-93]